jgi:hypothetical protein
VKKTEIAAIADGFAPVMREYVEKSVREAIAPIRTRIERLDGRVEGKPPQRHPSPKSRTVDLRGFYPAKRRLPVVYLDNRPRRRAGVVWL